MEVAFLVCPGKCAAVAADETMCRSQNGRHHGGRLDAKRAELPKLRDVDGFFNGRPRFRSAFRGASTDFNVAIAFPPVEGGSVACDERNVTTYPYTPEQALRTRWAALS